MPGAKFNSSKTSKDNMLENAIVSSLRNPRHCLYYMEPKKPDIVAKTLINSNETYELEIHPKFEVSIHAHEQIHIISSNQTQFKRIILFNSLKPLFRIEGFSVFPIRVVSYKPSVDFHLIYNSEVIPYLEAFAILYQCRLKETPSDLRESLIEDLLVKNPALYGLIIDLEDIFERILEKGKSIDANTYAQIFALVTNLVFSTPNIVKERVFDRFRLLRELEDVPIWKNFNEIAGFLRNYFHENNYHITFTALGSPESILKTADFLFSLKKIVKNTSVGIPKQFIFGVLSEIDIQLGRISYFCDNLENLEGRRINRCYLGHLAKTKHFLSALKIMLNNANEMIQDKNYTQFKKMLIDFRNEIAKFIKIKTRVFENCPGPNYCKGRSDCMLRDILCQEVNERIFNLQKTGSQGEK
jgi:hypothetical protein